VVLFTPACFIDDPEIPSIPPPIDLASPEAITFPAESFYGEFNLNGVSSSSFSVAFTHTNCGDAAAYRREMDWIHTMKEANIGPNFWVSSCRRGRRGLHD
jgi:hypothetical protein